MDHYGKARREGLRIYGAAIQAHEDPYLPVLEETEPALARLNRKALGVQTVPLERVAGSVSRGRSYAFTRGFYPILESGSEFAGKWERLYTSVEENGINQPVTLLEYMGTYYVTEGNKRVSVMKCMGAVDIEGDVTRVIPPPIDDAEHQAYREYCDFTRETGIFQIYFTKPGSYQKLCALPGVRAGDGWTEDEILALRRVYSTFRSAYLPLRETDSAGTGDAFLTYLVAFGYQKALQDDRKKTAERVKLMIPEFQARNRVQLVMGTESRSGAAPAVPLISSLFRPSRIRAAFLYTRSPEDSAWEYWHEIGRLEMEKKLGDKAETKVLQVSSRTQFEEAIYPLIREGYTAIYATSPVMLNSCIEPALEHPEVKFFCCAPMSGYANIRTYYIRFYEAKFLMGLAAGILARNGKIGYVADDPLLGVPSAVNAFALGARMVNPEAKVYLNWSSARYYVAENPFEDPEIRVICNRDIASPAHGSRDTGLYLRENGSINNMATLIPRWGIFYRMMAERQLGGNLPSTENKNAATSYWWGMKSGVLDLVLSNRFDPYAARLISEFRSALQADDFTPFEGKLTDQAGSLRCGEERRLTPAEVLCMDYLLDNVVGDFPGQEQLEEFARPVVKQQGIHGEMKPESISFSRE